MGGRFGDWEIDTIVGKNNRGAILTLVERKSAFKYKNHPLAFLKSDIK
jgi:IS30 family transposase